MASTAHPTPQLTLSPDEARLITLRAQGFAGVAGRHGGVPGMLRRIGAVQLDTISVLARSHELVAYARLGPLPREQIERAYWNPGRATAFEYWSHAACVLPAEEWPYYAFRRRAMLARGMRWHRSNPAVCAEVLARLRAEGPLTATELGGARAGADWWDWSETKIAVEWLLDTGQVICARRAGWRRVYDLPERVLPAELLAADPSDAECAIHLAAVAARALGVVTRADLADYQRLRYRTAAADGGGGRGTAAGNGGGGSGGDGARGTAGQGGGGRGSGDGARGTARQGGGGRGGDGTRGTAGSGGGGRGAAGEWETAPITAEDAAAAAGLVPVQIAAARGRQPVPAWADPAALAAESGLPHAGGRHRVTLLSPFDSLIWDRKRTLRMFGFQHSLEAYLPRAKRVHGYFTMPLLARGRLIGRVDPARSGRTLVARKLTLDTPSAAEPMGRALREAAVWVGCDSVELGHVEPSGLEPRLRKAISG